MDLSGPKVPGLDGLTMAEDGFQMTPLSRHLDLRSAHNDGLCIYPKQGYSIWSIVLVTLVVEVHPKTMLCMLHLLYAVGAVLATLNL